MAWYDQILAALGLTQRTITDGILNFHEVVKGKVYRGGQPSRDGWKMLKSLGIVTVIKLNYPDEGLDDAPGFGVLDCHMPPRDFWQSIGKPDFGQVINAASYIASSASPVYVHCLHGQDRTGLVIGVWRVLFQGWTVNEAYAEMIKYGFHPDLHDVHEAWEDFSRDR
jgi:tyrosine-protein phosphatase SIW14